MLSVGLTIATPLILIPVLTTYLGVGSYGSYMAVLGVVALLVILGDLGLDMHLTKVMSISRDCNKTCLYNIFAFFIIRLSTFAFFLPLLLFLLIKTLDIESEQLLIVTCLLFASQLIKPTCLLVGLEKYKDFALIELCGKVVLLFLIFYLDFSVNAFYIALFAQCISSIFITIFLYVVLLSKVKYESVNIRLSGLINILKSSAGFYFSRLLINIYTQASVYIVSQFVQGESLGLYSIAVQLYKLGQAVIGAISKVLYTSTVKSKNFSFVMKATKVTLTLQVLIAPIVVFWGSEILLLAFNVNSKELLELVYIFYASLIFVTISSFWGYPVMVALNNERLAHAGVFFGSLFYYVTLIFIYYLNIFDTVAFASCIILADIAMSFLRIYFAYTVIYKNRVVSFS